ncbi:hypothetical protein BGX34_005892 [Mortierella sp. NVP85]|nr:hypothetical protein BGX34_005892 [Mortierella sp. NVP85]
MHSTDTTTAAAPARVPKVAIIGTGSVGSSIAFACLMRSVAPELLLYDINTGFAHGQVLDLEDSVYLSSANLASCSYDQDTPPQSTMTATAQDCGQADIIVVTAGFRQAPGESRDELLSRNVFVLRDVFTRIAPIKSSAIVIMVTNPVNIMTWLAQKLSGLPPNQVFGTGTVLDTMRLRTAIKRTFRQEGGDFEGFSENSINAYVIGDHGDKQVALWSSATVGGAPLTSFKPFEQLGTRVDVATRTTNRIYEIIKHKDASSFGIASIVADLIQAILTNKQTVLPLTVYSERYNACIALPTVLSAKGVGPAIYPQMDTKEQAALEAYVQDNRDTCAAILDFHCAEREF